MRTFCSNLLNTMGLMAIVIFQVFFLFWIDESTVKAPDLLIYLKFYSYWVGQPRHFEYENISIEYLVG
jgi:hypothetical protein